jgi:hypothetical protein
MDTTLGTPLADEAIRDINFFNGRLLTGGDLQREQAARQLADRRVGAACGPGIAWGLEVSALTGTPPGRVKVSSGLGVAWSGQVLHLATEPVVQLVAPLPEATASVSSGFGACGMLAGSPDVAGDGLFLLTLAPVTVAEGKAPVLALDAVNIRCTTDAFVEAVQLRLLRISDWTVTGTSAAAVALLRSQIAQAFLSPRSEVDGAMWRLRSGSLSDCDIPLAVVYLRDANIVFIDSWAVRRRLAAAAAAAAPSAWSAALGEVVLAHGEAQLLQFQAQIAETPAVLAGPASASLAWLPPAGLLPAGTGFSALQAFLASRAPDREMALADSDLPAVLAAALRGAAVDLAGDPAAGRYRAWRITGPSGSTSGPLLFTRDGRNLHAAEQIGLDDSRAGMPGVTDVQTAIDRLRAGSCLHLVLRRGMDIPAALRGLAGRDATVCFEPGRYKLDAPLVIENAGRVRVHGHGATLINAAGECALRVLGCRAVEVSDIAVEGRAVGFGKGDLDLGLLGALTIIDTPSVGVERVQASCAGGEALGAAGIVVTVRDKALPDMPRAHFTVTDCEITVGQGQQGLLCVNGDVQLIRGNRIGAADPKASLQRGIVVAGRQAGTVRIEGNVVRDVVRGIAVGLSEAAEAKGRALQAGRVTIDSNRVELQLADVTSGGRYGIFVGNAGSVLVRANHVLLVDGSAEKLQVQALRLAGFYGPQIIVRDNLFDGTWTGIALQTEQQPKPVLWAFQCNVGLGLGGAILEMQPVLRRLIVDEHNQQVTDSAFAPPR